MKHTNKASMHTANLAKTFWLRVRLVARARFFAVCFIDY
jgi:hypothetical protein